VCGLAFGKEGDRDGDEGVAVFGDEAVDHVAAEGLDCRRGA